MSSVPARCQSRRYGERALSEGGEGGTDAIPRAF